MLIPAITSLLPAISPNSRVSPSTSAGLSIEIHPSEDDVSSGDRSNNTAEVTVSSANREFSAEVSREQSVDRLESIFQQRKIEIFSFANGQQGISPLRGAVIGNSRLSREELTEIATIRLQRSLANTYINTISGDTIQSSKSGNAGQSGAAINGATLYNNAVDAYIKQTLFFSGLDKASSGFSVKA